MTKHTLDLDLVHPASVQYGNALHGLAIGDAWGFQVEFLDYDKMPHPVPMPKGVWRVSDDTQMTLALQNAVDTIQFLETGGNTEKDIKDTEKLITDEFIRWEQSPLNDRAPGTTCTSSIRALSKSGRRWFEVSSRSAGCGAVMRLLPTVVASASRWRGLTALQAVITHNNPMAVASALVLGEVARLFASDYTHDDQFAQSPIEVAKSIAEDMSHSRYYVGYQDAYLRSVLKPELTTAHGGSLASYLQKGADGLLLSSLTAASNLMTKSRKTGTPADSNDICASVGEGWDAATCVALSTLAATLYYYTNDATRSLEWAVTSNGDSDSIGAVAGMLIGLTSRDSDFWPHEGVEPVFEDAYQSQLLVPKT